MQSVLRVYQRNELTDEFRNYDKLLGAFSPIIQHAWPSQWNSMERRIHEFMLLIGLLGFDQSALYDQFDLGEYMRRVAELRLEFPYPNLKHFFSIISDGAFVTRLRFSSLSAEEYYVKASLRTRVCEDLIWCLERLVVSIPKHV